MNFDSTQTRTTHNKQNYIPFPERVLPQNSYHNEKINFTLPPVSNTRKSIRHDNSNSFMDHCFSNPKAVPPPQNFNSNGNSYNMINNVNNVNNTNLAGYMVNTNTNNSNHIISNIQNNRNNVITHSFNLKPNLLNDRMLPIDTRHNFKPQD